MVSIRADDPRAVAAFEAIHAGDVHALERLLVDDRELAAWLRSHGARRAADS